MKKLFVSLAMGALAAGAATGALAVTACSGAAGNGTDVPGATDGTSFVRVTFNPKCSANVNLYYTDQTTTFAVASASTKGKNVFIGNTAGGAIAPATGIDCASSGCAPDKVTEGLTKAEELSGS